MAHSTQPSVDHPWRQHFEDWETIDEVLRHDHLGTTVSASVYFAERRHAVKKEPRIPFRYSIKNCPQWVQDAWRETRRKHPYMSQDEFRMEMLVTLLEINLPRSTQKGSQS
jgi:hypothetical protein